MPPIDARAPRAPEIPPPLRNDSLPEACDHCGSTALEWVKCKLICRQCRQINKSCADL
ncbi:MAG TPA: hypothetical protein VF737_01015 [Gemmatimonadaceae bacterium]